MGKAFVKRANVLLEVEDFEVDRYIDLGYNLVTENGQVLKRCIPSDLGTLKQAYINHSSKIKELEKELSIKDLEISQLKATISKLQEASKTVKASEKKGK